MNWTLNDIKNTKVAALNLHLDKSVPKIEVSQKKFKKRSEQLGEMHLMLHAWCLQKGYELLTEHQFHEYRKYRFDFAIKEIMTAIEYEGGVLMQSSGHNTAKHFTKDTEKYNLGQIYKWRILRFTVLNYKSCIETLEALTKT